MTPLDRIAARARRDPFFLGFLLTRHARAEGLDDDALAASLGCRRDRLSALLACRAPRAEEGFREDIFRLSTLFGLDPDRLAEAVRGATALLLLEARDREGTPTLMAARDADEGGHP